MAEFYYTNENKKARCKKLDFAFVPIFEKVSKTCLPALPAGQVRHNRGVPDRRKYIPLIAAPVHVELELTGATEAQASAELGVL